MPTPLTALQSADLKITGKPFSIDAQVEVTPSGLLAIAGLVTGILLSAAALVWAAKQRRG